MVRCIMPSEVHNFTYTEVSIFFSIDLELALKDETNLYLH